MLREMVGLSVVGCVVALAAASLSVAQPGGGPGRPGGPGRFDPERMQQMMQERMREQLGATTDEWKVLGPRVMKVMQLNRQDRGGMRMMGRMMMGRGRRPGGQGGPGGPGDDSTRGNRGNRNSTGDRARRPRGGMFGEPTAVDTAAEALQTTLENASATPEEIKGKLTALRAAKEKAKQELAVAQKDLREVLTLRQEAQLVVMGLLD